MTLIIIYLIIGVLLAALARYVSDEPMEVIFLLLIVTLWGPALPFLVILALLTIKV